MPERPIMTELAPRCLHDGVFKMGVLFWVCPIILSIMPAPETFFTYEDAENAQAVFEGAEPEDFEDEAARR